MPRDLHALPRLSDRWSHLYLQHGRGRGKNHGFKRGERLNRAPIPVIDQVILDHL